ncbi:MAG: DNA repair exonuclease [Phycisphaerales bacterium]
MGLRVLVTSDLHIGRTSTRLPQAIGLDSETARAVSGWHSIVDQAITGGVKLLILAGDVADQDNRFWEAIGPLQAGLRRLAEHGVRTLAVSGNHDHDVLPRLADALGDEGNFTLLGRDGKWQRETVIDDGRPVLHVDGWSFPTKVVEFDPVQDYTAADGDGIPVVGVVHGDLDDPNSRFAPLSLPVLAAQPVNGWLLGHIHKPHLYTQGTPFVLYPGSPQALDFGERGVHGPWQFEVDAGRIEPPRQVPMSFCRYDEVEIDLTDVADDAGFETAVIGAVREAEQRMLDESGDRLQALSLRLRLVGRTSLFDRLPALSEPLLEYTGLTTGLAVRIDHVGLEVLPEINLESLARGSTPLGVAAGLLHAVETTPDAPEVQSLLADVTARMTDIGNRRDYLAVADEPWAEEHEARVMVRKQLNFIIGQLVRQQGGEP